MANLQQAPILQFDIEKPEGSNNFYKLPQQLMDAVFAGLGNSSAQLRIMIVLIGTKPGFGVSEEWILQRTSLLHSSYITARKALVDKGWITLEKGIIRVNFKTILNSSNMVLPQNNNNEISKTMNDIINIINTLIIFIIIPCIKPFFFIILHNINEEIKAEIDKQRKMPDSINLSSILV